MGTDAISLSVAEFRGFAVRVFEALGMAPEHADLMAAQITWAHVRGYPWLGAKKIIQYGTRIQKGAAATHGDLELVAEAGGLLAFDAGNSFSQVTGVQAMQAAIEKARSTGVCVAVVRNTSNASALGYFPNLAIEQRMIGAAINNSPPLMAPWGSREKIIGNQAFAWGSPAGRHDPIIFDTALSEMTLVAMHGYEARGESLPEGVALDAQGAPTTDPTAALAGILLPMGQHRGSGLAVIWEILTGILAGGERFLTDVTMPDVFDKPQGTSMFHLAINPEIVMPYDQFLARVDDMIDRLHASPTAKGVEQVRVPGEMAARRAREAQTSGMTLAPEMYAQLAEFAKPLGVRWE